MRAPGGDWQLGDGRLVIENRAERAGGGTGRDLAGWHPPAQARMTMPTDKTASAARILANLDGMAAGDLAAQAPPLAVLALLDAPISGRMLGELLARRHAEGV